MSRAEDPEAGTTHRIEVDRPTDDRLDRYLADRLPLSRSRIAGLIAEGRVRVNERIPQKSDVPERGDVIEVEVPPPEPAEAIPQDIPIDIVYEDEALLVVNKPAGMVVHPAPGHATGTLVNALLHRVGDLSGIGGVKRPGIVHRLDKDTSGLMVVAKADTAHRRLARALSRRRVSRRYLVACWGHLSQDSMTVEAPIGRDPRDRKRMAVVTDGRAAVTEFERTERWVSADLLEARLHTGRTHQIRVHLKHVGHPVVGDIQYAEGWEKGFSGTDGGWARELARRVDRQFLHAAELEFEHPVDGRMLRFEAPLPEDLAGAARWARETS